jgi:hypothetical protein
MEYKFEDFKGGEKVSAKFNPIFKFEEDGDTLNGFLVGNKKISKGERQKESNVWTLENATGCHVGGKKVNYPIVDFWGCAVIDLKLKDLALRRNAIVITYVGDGEAKGANKPPHLFSMTLVPTDSDGKIIEGATIYKVKKDATPTKIEEV